MWWNGTSCVHWRDAQVPRPPYPVEQSINPFPPDASEGTAKTKEALLTEGTIRCYCWGGRVLTKAFTQLFKYLLFFSLWINTGQWGRHEQASVSPTSPHSTDIINPSDNVQVIASHRRSDDEKIQRQRLMLSQLFQRCVFFFKTGKSGLCATTRVSVSTSARRAAAYWVTQQSYKQLCFCLQHKQPNHWMLI